MLAVTKRGPIILMCSDLTQDPVAALELYCARVRIETMFDMLKNLMGVFHYRFWTKSLERHSRKPRKNKDLKKPTSGEKMGKVRICFAAYERFVMIGAIALGLLQLVSIKYEKSVWKEFKGFSENKISKITLRTDGQIRYCRFACPRFIQSRSWRGNTRNSRLCFYEKSS